MTKLGLIEEATVGSEAQPEMCISEAAVNTAAPRQYSVHEEQIQCLVQELFFRQDAPPVRHVGFAAAGTHTDTAHLCLDVAKALAEAGSHDVGLIDARLQGAPLHTHLQIPAHNRGDASWLIAPRLWLSPRRSWLDESRDCIWDSSLLRLRTITNEFDFSILYLDPVSWLTAKLCQNCNGLVMVLTANKTRRLVAAQMQEQLRKVRVPLLGTVLAERRFPIPTGLYRNL